MTKTYARQGTNLQLLDILKDYLEKYPDQRFSQALANLGFVVALDDNEEPCEAWNDDYHLEPWDLMARVQKIGGKLVEK